MRALLPAPRRSPAACRLPEAGVQRSDLVVRGHYCGCGHYDRTLAGLRKHASTCSRANAEFRRAEDRARVERVEHAKKINDAAREDERRGLLKALKTA